MKIFQYRLTGLYKKGGKLIGTFFKGMLAVIDDDKWPKKYAHAALLVSSKDQKLNQAWAEETDKIRDQNTGQTYRLRAVLVVKREATKKPVVGISKKIAIELATDFDGDEYDLIPLDEFPALAAMLEKATASAIKNPKIKKSFTPRTTIGDIIRIIGLRKPLLETWVGINNRFYYLPEDKREGYATKMAQEHMLNAWLGPKWADSLPRGQKDLDIVTAEMQLGIKYGEDIYKTSVDGEALMMRAKAFEKVLDEFNVSALIPYGNGYKKQLQKNKDYCLAAEPTLAAEKSANIVHAVSRRVARSCRKPNVAPDFASEDER